MFSLQILSIFFAVLSLVLGSHGSWLTNLPAGRDPLGSRPTSGLSVVSPASTPETVPVRPVDPSPAMLVLPVAEDTAPSQTYDPPREVPESLGAVEVGPNQGSHSLEAVKYLAEVAFGVEYGSSDPTLHKWVRDVRVKVHGRPTKADQATLSQVVDELNSLLTDVSISVTEEDANVELYFLPESRFSAVEPEYIPVNLGFFRVWWNSNGAIHRARVLIASEGITQQERSHLIREELTQSLGLFKDSWACSDSIFYQGWTATNEYSSLDRASISVLYSGRLEPGMTLDEALDILPTGPCCSD